MRADIFDFNTAKVMSQQKIDKLSEGLAEETTSKDGGSLPTFEPRRSKFLIEYFDNMEPSREPGLVKGLWPRVGVSFVYGPSMSGKSFFMLDAAVKVAKGEPVLGRRSTTCGVLYIASEDPGGVRLRSAGLRQQAGSLGPRFAFIGSPPNLSDPDDVADLRATINDVQRSMQASGVRLGLVVVDTFSASTAGADENSAKDMGPVLAALQGIAEEMSLLVVVVHHSGKDVARGARGWSGLFANADGVIALEAAREDELRVGRVVKVKNGESGWGFAFTLKQVEVGLDDDGDLITTCVVEEAKVPEADKGRSRLTARQRIMLRAIKICLDNGIGVQPPLAPGIQPGDLGVKREAAKEQAIKEGFADQGADPESVRRALNQTLASLIAKGFIREQQGVLMLIHEPRSD